MRVLQLHNRHAGKGGATDVLAHERDLLAGHGHEVEQYTVSSGDDMGLSPVRAAMKAVWNVEACRDVDAVISRFRPDVVHVHTPFPLLSPAVFRAARRRGVATVATLHSYRYSCIAATCFRNGKICEDCVGKAFKLDGLRHRCYHDSLGASGALTLSLAVHRGIGTFHHCVDKFLPLTEFAKRMLCREGIPEHKIEVKGNSVQDPGDRVRRRSTAPYLAFAGRLVDVKGIRTVLDAWRQIDDKAGYRLRIAGDGPLGPLVAERCAADDTIDFLGWLDEGRLNDFLAGAEAVVVPSEWYEGYPLVILRSLAVGTPVVVSDLENMQGEVLADRTGWPFVVGDAASLARTLRTVMQDGPGRQAAGVRARGAYLRRYSPAANLERLEAIYLDVTTTRSRG